MFRKCSGRSALFVIAGLAACLMMGGGTPLGIDTSNAGPRAKAEKLKNYAILAGGLGTPTGVAMVNQVVPRFSPYSTPILPMIDVLARGDLLVTTGTNLSGLAPVPGFPPGAVVRVRRPLFAFAKSVPPDSDNNGLSDNATLFSENNVFFTFGTDPVVITPGLNGFLNTNPAQDDVISGSTITNGPNGVPESGRCGDDLQTNLVGQTGLSPTSVVVAPGPNGILETNPVNDDVVGPAGGCAVNNICAGLNGAAESGRGSDDAQAQACVGRFLNPTDIILDGGPNRFLNTPVRGDDVPVIAAAADQTGTGATNFDSDTTACQNSDGSSVGACDDVQLVPPGTVVANRNVAVVGPGVNGGLETPPNSGIIAGGDLDADTGACRISGNPALGLIVPCDDVQEVPVGTTGLTVSTRVVAPGPDNILQTPARLVSIGNRDVTSFDTQGVQAGQNQTGETGPPAGDDVQIVAPLASPNQNVPPVSAPVGIESVVTMYPAVANMVDPNGNPANSGSVAFLSSGVFSLGSNGDNLPIGDSAALGVGLPSPGPFNIGVFSGAEAATDGSNGLLSGLAGFTYGGFGWTDLSFKRLTVPQLPPDLKDNVYYATRKDGGIALVHYRRGRVSDVLPAGILSGPTDLAYLAPTRALCIGASIEGGAGIAAKCGPQDMPGTDAGSLYVVESGNNRIAIVPLEIANVLSDNGLCASLTGSSGLNPDSGQGDFCDPKTGLRTQGGSCTTGGTCHTTGVGLPNTRIVADTEGITFLAPQFITDPVAISLATTSPVPHSGRLTSGQNGISETTACNPNAPGTCDDVQTVPVGQGFPNARAIDAPPIGNQFNLMTTPQGDDIVVGGVTPDIPQIPGGNPPTTILTGPNGITETTACNPNPPGSCTDIQNIPVGEGEPFQRIIEAGPDGIIDTTPQGDDRVVDSPTLIVANGSGTVVWMDLNGFDPITHIGPPRFFKTPLSNITGMAVGDFINGEGIQVFLTTTDFGGALVSFDLTLADNTQSLAATLQILTDLNDTVSEKLDPTQVPITLPNPTRATGLTHVALDYWPGRDGFIGTADDPHFDDPNSMIDISNISLAANSEPNEISTNGQGANIYSGGGGARALFVVAGSYSVNTLNAPFDGILDNDPTIDLYNFISGNIAINVGKFSSQDNCVLAGPDKVVQTTACQMPGGAPIPNCDDVQLSLAGETVFTGPQGASILAGDNGTAQSGLGGDDVQVQPVGMTFGVPGVTVNGAPYTIWTTNVVGIGPGGNGVLDTCPGGDDTVGAPPPGILGNGPIGGIFALCPNVVPSAEDCPADFRALGIFCTVPTPSCPENSICTGPNGVVNSGLALDDVQIVQPGATGLGSGTAVVGPGPNGFIETSPGGEDLIGNGQALDIVIEPGPDNILQTPPAPGDVGGRLTTISVVDLDVFASSRPITSLATPTMPYAFLDPAGANSGVVDISNGKTANALDAAVDGVFPNSSSFFGPNYESPTGEIDFIVRDISLTASIDNNSGLVIGRGVERNSRLPALSLVYLDASLAPANNAFVGSAIVGRQLVRTPRSTFQPDRTQKKAPKVSNK